MSSQLSTGYHNLSGSPMPEQSPAYNVSNHLSSSYEVTIYTDELKYHTIGTISVHQKCWIFLLMTYFLIFDIHLLSIIVYFELLLNCTYSSYMHAYI